jgi:hypothetical protein
MNLRESRPPRARFVSPFAKPPVEPVEPEVYAVDDRVSHDKWGLGTVVRLDGTRALIVNFGAETRRIEVPSPKICRL